WFGIMHAFCLSEVIHLGQAFSTGFKTIDSSGYIQHAFKFLQNKKIAAKRKLPPHRLLDCLPAAWYIPYE
ncbi:MAG: hypothetical protein NTX06_11560, partial [Proteobacteria bacterium]|nr:hypothetical protein [Pseudomonadota bacterium]